MLAEAEPWASPELRAGRRSTATAWEAACGWPAGRGRCHSAAAHEGRNGPWKSAVLLSFRDELCSLVLLRPSDQAETGPARMAVGCGWALACLWLQFLMRPRLRAALLASNHSFRIISVCRGARLKHHPRVGRVHPSGALTDLIAGGGCRRRARSRLDFMLFFLFRRATRTKLTPAWGGSLRSLPRKIGSYPSACNCCHQGTRSRRSRGPARPAVARVEKKCDVTPSGKKLIRRRSQMRVNRSVSRRGREGVKSVNP